jgi:glycosyltransferase involved in cell wall biosynthesis
MAAVLASYSRMAFWSKYRCVWVATVDTRTGPGKLLALARALFLAFQIFPGCSIVHVHVAPHRSFYRKALFVWLARLFGKSIIVHVHAGDFGVFWTGGGTFRRSFVSATMRSARLVMAVSEPLAEDLRRCSGDLAVLVMPNPFENPAALRPERQSRLNVLFAGRIERDKGIFDLIRAFAEVRRVIADARLVIAGEGMRTEAEALMKDLGLNGAVEFPGWLGDQALAERYAEATVFCLPSYAEGMPIAVLQAMAAGVPVVATAVGGIRDLLKPDAGITVAPGDVAGLAEGLIQVLGSERLRRSLSFAAAQALADHAPGSVNDRLDAVYSALLDRRPAREPALNRI